MSGPEAGTNAGDDGGSLAMRWRGFWWRLLIAMVIIGLFTGTAVALVDRGFTHRVAQIERIPGLQVAPSPPGGANYLIIGSDTREFATDEADQEAFGSPEEETGKRSDTMMVAHVEPGSQKTFVVSFPRDLMVDIPGYPGKNQINAAYSLGDAQLVIDTLHENFNIDINHYLEVDFESFEKIVDTIGAVQVYFPKQVRDQDSGLQPLQFGPGCYYLNGGQALAYVRSRKLEEYLGDNVWVRADSNSDLDRIGRQQYFIKKLAGLAIQKSLSDPFLGADLVDTILKYIRADGNLNRDDVNALVRAFKTVDVNDPNSIRSQTLPVEAYPADPNRVQAAYPAAEAVAQELGTFGDNKPPPASVLPSQVTVKVLDGTGGTNIGQGVVTKLAEEGFKASGGATTTKIDVTEIRYGYDSAVQAKALVSYFPDAKVVLDPTIKAGVELVLGANFSGEITVPSTTTTAPASTLPGSPPTKAPSSSSRPTTTTGGAIPSDACPQ